MDSIKVAMGTPLEGLKDLVGDRSSWRKSTVYMYLDATSQQ